MEHTYLITGFPGFIATKLLEALQSKYPSSHFYLLILKQERRIAEQKMMDHKKNITLIEGDITKDGLGLAKELRREIAEKLTHCIHLAALYDLTAAYAPSYSCNVLGTENVLKFVITCKNLKRFAYFSTAYVSGEEKGQVVESNLSEPSSYRNFYEQTKNEAERIVRMHRDELPITILRPGIIVGDSKTGQTIKFDGPYFMMRFLSKLSSLPIPYIGRSTSKIHLVPVDFIVNASVYLIHDKRGESKTYHLLSPSSPKIQEAYTLICKELTGKKPSWQLPRSIADKLLSLSFFSKWLGVPREILSYFSHEADYDTSQLVHDLEGTGITCPDFEEYVPVLVRYYKENASDVTLRRY
ncbi:SDR family oxidoreductase [Fictibacillus phosphorivorans]|uniref:SDR family oxidoreductase n=1 Tax=Fictibacillus phosphorivorans TaxID=1221500 RepID=UPI00204125A6|nr:SDR family oxidoreductase [Fictibacillus phosphorivorans]MCM3719639.1 SDR family oxidoreductase [Fictibacillus phosphorivorans]MCM3777287.1 SDR family oxidoreductase [Fictibacillus phosphorivorans]